MLSRSRVLRALSIVSFTVALAWPATALANPPRPSWSPGPPWAPLAPASGEMSEISNLFWIMLALSAIVFAIVAGAVILSIVRFSAKPGASEPEQVFGNKTIEFAWTLIPTVILILAFIATVKSINDINSPHKGPALDVNAIGHQWWWEFQYPSLKIVTADEVHIPAGYSIHFHVMSADVIHSFWTPQLQRQVDANPGQDNAVYVTMNRPGIYGGMCYEYCGTAHAWMKYRLVVQPPAQFQAWARHQQTTAATASGSEIALGRHVFQSNTCINCHAITGLKGAGGAVGPNLTHLASRWTIAAGAAPLTQNDLMEWIKNPTAYKPGVLMPGYPFLSQRDLHAVAAYLMTLK